MSTLDSRFMGRFVLISGGMLIVSNLCFGQFVYQSIRPVPAGDNPDSQFPDTTMGDMPIGQLIEGADGKLYGTTSVSSSPSGGGVFRVNKDGSDFVTLCKFGLVPNDCSNSWAGLVQGGNGSFYGTTFFGGTNTLGTVFRVTPSGNGGYTNKILKSFTGNNGDGANPSCKLIVGTDGWLYGTTYNGGSNNVGVIFKMQTNGVGFTNLHTFSTTTTDSSHPLAGLVQGTNGMLFGVSSNGAASAGGAVFRIATNGTGYTILHSFTGASGDGMYPVANLVCDTNNTLYGVTLLGGASGFGTIFKINGDGSGYTVLTNLTGSGNAPGAQPRGSLAFGDDGLLYGTAELGGRTNHGTVFRLSKNGSGYTVLHNFDFSTDVTDGRNPRAGLAKGSDGAFYGTTFAGGQSPNTNFNFVTDLGTIFSLGPRPPNDAFVNRIPLVGLDATAAGYNLNATLETNEPAHLNSTVATNTIAATNSIWWSWSGLSDGLVTIVDDADTVHALIDVYTNLSANCVANPSGLVNWWRGENDGNDSAGGNNAVLSNGVAFATGKVGQAFSFDGIDDLLQINAPAVPPPWSAEFWVNRQASTNDSAVLIGDFATALKLEQYQNIKKVGYTIWGVKDYHFTNSTPVPTNTWTHLVVVGSTTNLQLYINGAFVDSINTNWTLPRGTIGYDLARGNKKQLKGLLDEISLYNRMLTPTEIQALFVAGSSGKCSVANLTNIASNGSSPGLGSESRVSFIAKPGVTYQIATSGTVDMSVGPHFAGSGPISLSMRALDLRLLSVSSSTNPDSTINFTNQIQIGNGGSITPGSLRVKLIAQAGFSTAPSSNAGILLLPDQLLSTYVLTNPATVVPGATNNITITGLCPAPTNYVVNGITNPIGWGVFAQLEEQVGTNWLAKDKALALYSVWPSSGGFTGPGGGVIRINPTGGTGVVRLTNTTIIGPLTVNEGATNAYQGFARFSDGGTFTFSNTVWTASRFTITTNGLFHSDSITSNTPVTLGCYYVYDNKTNNATTNITVLDLPGPRLTNFALLLPSKQFQFVINGVPGRLHVIEATTNLGTPTVWTSLATNAISPGGTFIFTDPASSSLSRRFYRAHEQ
jgi:uncharacterized repeat protein (TIGR03803 family)